MTCKMGLVDFSFDAGILYNDNNVKGPCLMLFFMVKCFLKKKI